MFRKLTIALGATAALGAAALAPTAASAPPSLPSRLAHGWHGGFGFGLYAPVYDAGPDCYVVKRLVETPYGRAGAA